jgi:hypothetical protein
MLPMCQHQQKESRARAQLRKARPKVQPIGKPLDHESQVLPRDTKPECVVEVQLVAVAADHEALTIAKSSSKWGLTFAVA